MARIRRTGTNTRLRTCSGCRKRPAGCISRHTPGRRTIGKVLDDAMVAIERDNPSLKGVLPKEYGRPNLDKQRLGERGHKVMLDTDLAALYDVPVKALNQAVKRNLDRFPADFMFQLSPREVARLR